MESKILQSIIKITKQRDLDSFEYSLVATLAELLPVDGLSILKGIKEQKLKTAEEVVRLFIKDNNGDEKNYAWSGGAIIIVASKYFKECVNLSQIVSYKHDEGFTRTLFPIHDDTQAIGTLVIDATDDISAHTTLIEGFVKIYENYMVVFNESEKDKLTGLFNRRTFDNKLQKLFQAQKYRNEHNMQTGDKNRRHNEPGTSAWLIITDIDHFKNVNDTYGHVFGDEVLLTISQKMKTCFRNSDLLFRIGGEEFVILLSPVTEEQANALIDRFRRTIAEHEFAQIGTVTVSAGYAAITERDFPPAILECADKALYYAKAHGRNCIYNYESLIKKGNVSAPKQGGAIDLF